MIVTISTVGYGRWRMRGRVAVRARAARAKIRVSGRCARQRVHNLAGDVVMSTWVTRLIVIVIIGAALFVIPEQLNHLSDVTRLRSGMLR